jgi:RHS repeat-associated protein
LVPGTPGWGPASSPSELWSWSHLGRSEQGPSCGSRIVRDRRDAVRTPKEYNWNRYYDTGLGAYESADPLGLRAGLNAYRYGFANPLGWTDFEGLQSYADDTISARAKSLAARGRYQDLKDFLSQHADDIPKDKAEQLLKACKNALEKRAKAAEKLRKTDPDFADYFHRRYKPDGGVTPGGGRRNPDARAEELVDAAEEYFGPSF